MMNRRQVIAAGLFVGLLFLAAPAEAAITYITQNGTATVGVMGISCPLPNPTGGIQKEDIGLWHTVTKEPNSVNGHTYPADWTKVSELNQGTCPGTLCVKHSWAWKRFSGGETGSPALNHGNTDLKMCRISLWRGVQNSGNPHRASTSAQATSGTVDPAAVGALSGDMIVALIGVGDDNAVATMSAGTGVGTVTEAYEFTSASGFDAAIVMDYALATASTADLGSGGVISDPWIAYQLSLVPLTCSSVNDASYVAATAQSGQVIVNWSSTDPVIVLRKQTTTPPNAFSGTEKPVLGSNYTQGTQPWGTGTTLPWVLYDGAFAMAGATCTATSCVDNVGVANNGTTYYYKVFAKTSTKACYAAGTGVEVNVKPVAATTGVAWSYAQAGGSTMTPGIAGWDGSITTGSNAGLIVSLDTTTGTQRWVPVGTPQKAVQGWLTWLPVGSGWSNGSWTARKKITILGAKVGSGGVADFPVLVYVKNDTGLKNQAQALGQDILFTSSDGKTKLSHEIEKFDKTAGDLIAWVKVPWLPSGADTDIYMYYGNPAAGDQQNATDVWTNGYVGVWHLQQDVGSGAAGDIKDSTTRNNGTFYKDQSPAALTSNDLVQWNDPVPGQIGGALKFTKGTDAPSSAFGTLVDMGEKPAFALPIYSWSMWIKGNVPVVCPAATNQQPLYNADTQFQFNWGQATTSACQAAGHADAVNVFKQSQITGPLLLDNTWYYVAATYDGAYIRVYLNNNGVPKGTIAAGPPIPTTQTGRARDFAIGNRPPDKHRWEGQLDEVRVGNVVRTDQWILTEFNNQNSPGTFYNVGLEEPGTWTPSTPCTSCSYAIGGNWGAEVYSVDELTGATKMGNLSAKANKIQAPVAAQLYAYSDPTTFQAWYWNTYGYQGDVIFVASYNDTSAAGCTGVNNTPDKSNKVFALKATDVSAPPMWVFNDVPCTTASNAMGRVSGMPYVDYQRNHLYVTSGLGGAATFWVLSSLNGAPIGSLALGQIDASPTLSGDRSTIYVATATGAQTLYAIAADATAWTTSPYPTGAVRWSLLLSSAVRGFVWEAGGKVYFATANGNVWCVQDGAACPGWPAGGRPVGASGAPLLMNGYLYVGATDGKLHQLRVTDGLDVGTPFPASGTLDGTFTLGDVSSETGSEVFIGTSSGRIFKITVPL